MADAGIPFELFFDTKLTSLACDTTLAASTAHTFNLMSGSQSKLYCPISGTRTFRQVLLRVNVRWASSTSTIAAPTKFRYALQFAGGGFSADTDINGTSLTSKAQSQELTVDITSAVAAAFTSGTDIDFDVRVTFCTSTAGNVNAVTCSVVGVVDIDDASSRSMMTVRLPLDVPDSALTTSLAELRTNQWPNLSTLIPYANKTFLNVALELECNTNQGGAGAHNLEFSLDAESGVARASIQNGAIDARYYDVWVRNDATTNATHAVKMKSTVAAIYRAMKVQLVVTFSYDVPAPGTSGGSFVSRLVPFVLSPGSPPENAASPKLKHEIEYIVPESNPVLKQSALAVDFGTTYGGSISLISGSQGTAQTYVGDPSHGHCSHHSFTHRIDSGARYGAGVTLARGRNKATLTAEEGGSFTSCGYTGLMVLNYVCDTPAAGDFAKTRTYQLQQCTSATALGETTGPNHSKSGASAKLPTFTTDWALASPIGYNLRSLTQSDVLELRTARLYVGTGSGELPASSFVDLGQCDIQTCSGYGHAFFACKFVDEHWRRFYRWAGDPDSANRLDPTASRNFRVSLSGSSSTQPAARLLLGMIVDWHGQSFEVAGQVLYAPDPSGITLYVHRSDTGEVVASCTSAADGTYSAMVPEPGDYIVQGVDGSGNRGRSAVVTAA